MIPLNTSLVKYDNPVLVSRTTDKKGQRKAKSPLQSPAPGVPGSVIELGNIFLPRFYTNIYSKLI